MRGRGRHRNAAEPVLSKAKEPKGGPGATLSFDLDREDLFGDRITTLIYSQMWLLVRYWHVAAQISHPDSRPARANRRSALKPTGPRTAQGKGQSRMNGLRHGGRSRFYQGLWRALFEAPPCAVDRTARAILTPELAAHPNFARVVEMFRQAEIEVITERRTAEEREVRAPLRYALAGQVARANSSFAAGVQARTVAPPRRGSPG